MSSETSTGGQFSGDGGSSVASPTVVPREFDRMSSVTATVGRSAQGPTQPVTLYNTSLDNSGEATTSRLESVRRLHRAGVSEKASELITSGWSKGTNVAY